MRTPGSIALLLCLAVLSGCANLVTGGPLVREGEPTGTLVVQNDSTVPINVVLLVPCSASSYGLNRLPSGLSIPHRRSYRFTVSAGCWAVIAGSTTARAEAREELRVAPGGITAYTVGASGS